MILTVQWWIHMWLYEWTENLQRKKISVLFKRKSRFQLFHLQLFVPIFYPYFCLLEIVQLMNKWTAHISHFLLICCDLMLELVLFIGIHWCELIMISAQITLPQSLRKVTFLKANIRCFITHKAFELFRSVFCVSEGFLFFLAFFFFVVLLDLPW